MPGRPDGSSGNLYSLAGITAYQVNDYFSLKGRFEWYHDQDAIRTPVGTDLYGLTVGTTITPLPHDRLGKNLKIRPNSAGTTRPTTCSTARRTR